MHIPNWPPISFQSIAKTDLSNMFKLLEALGNPHLLLPPTIHVAGTNGKGSTIAMLKSIFNQAGYKTHAYTSPHLLEFNERITISDEKISDIYLDEILRKTKQCAEKLDIIPTFFEGITAAAFLAFSRSKADILLLETGIGGRLDSTNVIPNPIITIITPISLDHQNYLGNSILEIAYEKAGIIKPQVPCIISMQQKEVYDLLLNTCDERSAPSFCFEYDYCAEKNNDGFNYISQKFNLNFPQPNLLGFHQIINASSVIAAVTLINDKFKINSKNIENGLRTIKWLGRIQEISKSDVVKLTGRDNVTMFIDGAHNDGGAICLADWARNNIKTPAYLILGMTRNRDATNFCIHFRDFIQKGVATKVESEPSSYNAEILAQNASLSGIEFTSACSLQQAITDVVDINPDESFSILITGSLFLVSDLFKLLS